MSINTSSLNRITGLASGMDTDTMVKNLMSGEQAKLDKLNQQQQKDMWLVDAYRQWNTDLSAFQTNTLYNMKMSSTFNAFNITASDPSSVSGTGSGSAVAGNYNIQVKQLAQPAIFKANNVKLDPTKYLNDTSQGTREATSAASFTISVPGSTGTLSAKIQVDPTKETINDVVNSINTATDTATGQSLGVQAIYDQTLQQFVLKTTATGANQTITLSNDPTGFLSTTLGLGNAASVTANQKPTSLPLQISDGSGTNPPANNSLSIDLGNGPVAITLASNNYSSTQSLVDEINKEIAKNPALESNVYASIDSTSGNIKLNSEITSSQSSVSVSGSAAGALGFTTTTSSQPVTSTGTYSAIQGQNADIVFNGNEINTLSSNTATIMGINWTFKTPTVDSSGNPTTNTVNVSQDIDTEVKNITDFINSYNDLLNKLNTADSEPVYSNYQPLTDAQKSSMTDTQVQQWETQAKSGLLHNDTTLNSLINNMRNDMGAIVNTGSTTYNSLASIGIASTSYLDKGKLTIDPTKLRTALQTDPDAVTKLFSNLDSTDPTKNGIMNQLGDDINNAVTDLTAKAGSTGNSYYDQSSIGKMLTDIQNQITTETDTFNTRENQYYAQFSAMEQAMQKYTSQSNWLTSALSGSSGA